ncbi:2-C-methyl-D-erythritol 2,4-cyclodiphosphate synthase [Candidatus Curtissbacteria bacterium RBG_13_35_7]|uniref:2-C-methyl-D-erythritol 2,4-cyclodiphosphate synthase n=1 Tax=Candidatus Curtissbacteria bacterium RBG_13_35_7 TaxID=1797705 RepID=A0A1F5G3S1_9BACT|nr:MAG: 2-C-methyl-D-erythritol 2,4-cyclodiphosphate synthase [Candidatus Curtissbacteria bacterium RBG_13_35_7]
MQRVGLGQDSHKFAKSKKLLVLGGIKISSINGLLANSDGDVILHSLCNALSSSIGGDSLSTWSDKMCQQKGIKDSQKYLKFIFNKVKLKKYKVENVSIAVEAKKPRLDQPIINKIKINIAKLLQIKKEQVGITFTSGEGLTDFGKGKGIQVLSIVNIYKK